MVRSQLIRLVPAWIWRDGEWMSEFRPNALKKRFEEKNVRKWWSQYSQGDNEYFGKWVKVLGEALQIH